jgi:hypothetical protein
MSVPRFLCLALSRVVLIAAVLLGQFTGGGACCCWIKYCVGNLVSVKSDPRSHPNQTTKIACPKCLAKLKKAQRSHDQAQESCCQCVSHTWLAVKSELKVDSRIVFDGWWLTAQMVAFPPLGPSICPQVLNSGNRARDRLHWQARACIWRI